MCVHMYACLYWLSQVSKIPNPESLGRELPEVGPIAVSHRFDLSPLKQQTLSFADGQDHAKHYPEIILAQLDYKDGSFKRDRRWIRRLFFCGFEDGHFFSDVYRSAAAQGVCSAAFCPKMRKVGIR